MKKETLVTIVVFLGVGFLGGYAYNAHKNSVRQRLPAESAQAGSAKAQAGDASGPAPEDNVAAGLPQGHPPVNAAEIIHFFESAAAKNPSDSEPRLKLADFLYDQQRWGEAIPWYSQALRLQPRNVDALTDLSTCYFNLGRFKKAIDELDRALKIDPHHEATLFNLVVVNMDGTHDLASAQKAWEELKAINPVYPHLEQLKQSLDAEMAATRKVSP